MSLDCDTSEGFLEDVSTVAAADEFERFLSSANADPYVREVADAILTEQDAAAHLKLTLEQFRELQAGPHPVPTFQPLPGLVRIYSRDLERWIEEATAAPGVPAPPPTASGGPRPASDQAVTGTVGPVPWAEQVAGGAITPLRTYPEARQPWMRR